MVVAYTRTEPLLLDVNYMHTTVLVSMRHQVFIIMHSLIDSRFCVGLATAAYTFIEHGWLITTDCVVAHSTVKVWGYGVLGCVLVGMGLS